MDVDGHAGSPAWPRSRTRRRSALASTSAQRMHIRRVHSSAALARRVAASDARPRAGRTTPARGRSGRVSSTARSMRCQRRVQLSSASHAMRQTWVHAWWVLWRSMYQCMTTGPRFGTQIQSLQISSTTNHLHRGADCVRHAGRTGTFARTLRTPVCGTVAGAGTSGSVRTRKRPCCDSRRGIHWLCESDLYVPVGVPARRYK